MYRLLLIILLFTGLFYSCNISKPTTLYVYSPFLVELNVTGFSSYNFTVANLFINNVTSFYLYLPAGSYVMYLNCSNGGTPVEINKSIIEISNTLTTVEAIPFYNSSTYNNTFQDTILGIRNVKFGFIGINIFEFLLLIMSTIAYVYAAGDFASKMMTASFFGVLMFALFYIINLVSFIYLVLFILLFAVSVALIYTRY